MSQENVEVVRQFYPGPIDVAAILASPDALGAVRAAFEPLVDPDFETVHDPRYQMMLGESGTDRPPESPRSISYGIDGFVTTFREWLSAWESWVVTPVGFIEADEDRVLAVLEIKARSKTHGMETTIKSGDVLTFRDGKLARLELFLQRAEAFEAVGLSEQDIHADS